MALWIFSWAQKVIEAVLCSVFYRFYSGGPILTHTGSLMVVTLGRQYNTGEKPSVMLYTYINRHAGTPDKNKKQLQTSSWHLKGFPDGSNIGSTV